MMGLSPISILGNLHTCDMQTSYLSHKQEKAIMSVLTQAELTTKD